MKRHLHVGAILVALGLLGAFLAGAFTDSSLKTIHGTKLNSDGQKAYAVVEDHGESGLAKHGEALPPAIAAKVAKKNAALAHKLALAPHPLATALPAMESDPITTNYSSRNGAKPILLVAHDTESPNEPGLADDLAIRAWFNNPRAQASANYVVDGDGNTIELVPDTLKAWHVAYFNPYAIGVEQVGYASQTSWPLAQYEATARIFAHEATKYGIPIQLGAVSGCTITRPGIVFHATLGACGGGHHDPGAHYSIAKLISLTKMYASAVAPTPAPKPVHLCKPVIEQTLKLGDHGFAVRRLQNVLDCKGAKVTQDADFGPGTKAAVVAFQKAHGLPHFGVVGPGTRKELDK